MSASAELAYEQDEEARWYAEQAQMSADQQEQMLADLFEREVLQPAEMGKPDYLQEAFLIVEGELMVEPTKDHLVALSRYFSAKLSIHAA